MNCAQKTAWFTLIVVSLAVGLSIVTFAVGFFVFGVPAHRAAAGFGFMGIVGLIGLTPILFRKSEGKVPYDERDTAIQRRAVCAAYGIFWVLFVAAAMVPWFLLGPQGAITVNYLPWMVFGGMSVVMLVQAVVTLAQYGWTNKETSHE